MQVELTINGEKHKADVEPRLLLVHLLRDVLRLTGTHIGCDTTHCGACRLPRPPGIGRSPALIAIRYSPRPANTAPMNSACRGVAGSVVAIGGSIAALVRTPVCSRTGLGRG